MDDATAPRSDIERLLAALLRHGVEFVLVGGQAEALQGSPRVTYDLDVCYRRSPDNIANMSAALLELNARLRGAPEGLPFRPDPRTLGAGLNFTFSTDLGDFDILGEVEPLGAYERVVPLAETIDADGMPLRVLGVDALLAIKQHLHREKDVESIKQLLAIKRMREGRG